MIARIWEGAVPAEKAETYIRLMRTVALPDYQGASGNVGAWCLHRIEGEVAHIQMLTLWTDYDAIRGFVGDEVERAKYYDFDDSFLIEKPEFVRHFTAYAD